MPLTSLFLLPAMWHSVVMKDDCIFCRIASGTAAAYRLYEDDTVVAFLDTMPMNPGHLLLIPKTHIADIFDTDTALYASLFSSVRTLGTTLRSATGAKRIGIAVEGFGVPHVHIHLVPIEHGNQLDPNRATKVTDDKLQETQKNLLPFFSNLHK